MARLNAAINKVLAKTGWTVQDVDLFEINEAFAAQIISVERELKLDRNKLNTIASVRRPACGVSVKFKMGNNAHLALGSKFGAR